MKDITNFHRFRAIPLVTIEDGSGAAALGLALADALAGAGLACLEVTLRTSAGLSAIAAVSEARPDFLIGAGSILDEAAARAAIDAGAKFLVSPGFDPGVGETARAGSTPYIPGALTPTEITRLLNEGYELIKIFPVGAVGGPEYLRAVAAPFPMARFIPTGGVGAASLGQYLSIPSVVACGGSWIARPDWLAERRFDLIADAARAAVEFVI